MAISGLRSGAVGRGRSNRTRPGVPAAGGLGEQAQAGPLGELGEHVPGVYAEPVREFPAGPVLAGLAGQDTGDAVSSAVRAGRAGTGPGGWFVRRGRAAGRSGGGTTMVICTREIVTDWQGRSWSRSWSRTW